MRDIVRQAAEYYAICAISLNDFRNVCLDDQEFSEAVKYSYKYEKDYEAFMYDLCCEQAQNMVGKTITTTDKEGNEVTTKIVHAFADEYYDDRGNSHKIHYSPLVH